ncbi:unnamed protein product [Vicia faba]|uniref:Uncharacterized protein n=1 Tax=Vicia faba TaxID=3906 RepID=A0AAV0Z8S3_VICFA|nr:unnamed protein product [Vicia faba]
MFVPLSAIANHHLYRFDRDSIFLSLSSLNPLNKKNMHYARGRNWRVLPTEELRRLFRATNTMRKPERNLQITRLNGSGRVTMELMKWNQKEKSAVKMKILWDEQIPSRSLMSLSMLCEVPINRLYSHPVTDDV